MSDPFIAEIRMFSGNFAPALSVKPESTISITNIELSPNPTNGIIIVHNAPENSLSASVFDILGKKVIDLSQISHTSSFTIDLTNLLAGIYYLRFVTGNSVVVRKIIRE